MDAHTHLDARFIPTTTTSFGSRCSIRTSPQLALRVDPECPRHPRGRLHHRARCRAEFPNSTISSMSRSATRSAKGSSRARACSSRRNGIGATGGHFDRHERFSRRSFRPAEPDYTDGIADGPEEIRKAVRYEVKNGADVIKAAVSGGVLSLADEVDVPQFSPEEMKALVDESHRLRKKVAVHCHGDAAAQRSDQCRRRLDRARLLSQTGHAAVDETKRRLISRRP